MNSLVGEREGAAPEEHFLEEITNKQSQGQSWLCGQTEDDVECGTQDGKDAVTPFTSAFKDFVGASLWKQMGLPFLILFSNYEQGKKDTGNKPRCAE